MLTDEFFKINDENIRRKYFQKKSIERKCFEKKNFATVIIFFTINF